MCSEFFVLIFHFGRRCRAACRDSVQSCCAVVLAHQQYAVEER